MTTNKNQLEDWLNRKWRPMMAAMYFVVCITDFIIFPMIWSMFQMEGGKIDKQWMPLTLQGAGLFHAAMGAILGIAAWTRGREKIARMDYYENNYHNDRYDRHYHYDNGNYRDYDRQSRRNDVIIGYRGKKAPPSSDEPVL